MEDNKKMNSETVTEATETSESKKVSKKSKKIKNQFLLKRGSYSAAITAIFIAGVIVLNVLVGILSDRFVLEYDMTADKHNSIAKENVDYIKNVEEEVNITVCAGEEEYAGGYMAYYANMMYGTENAADYYQQTVNLVKLYGDYNKKINVQFIDPQTTQFNAIASKYESANLNYGDIIVEASKNGNERSKIVTYDDIYVLSEDYTMVNGNDIETALTSAISYVISEETKTITFITGHSKNDYTSVYRDLLETNNYAVNDITDSVVSSIPEETDVLVIAAPSKDFMGSEIDIIAEFLENKENYKKGLIFFADASAPYLTNLYDFLAQWGIIVEEGILYETDNQRHLTDDPLTLFMEAASEDSINSVVNVCVSGNNVPLSLGKDNSSDAIKTEVMVATGGKTVAAPVGTGTDWTDAGNYTAKSYAGFIQASKESFDDDNNPVYSYIMAFSSTDFIYSAYNDAEIVSNKALTVAAAERAASAEDTGITFTHKTITSDSFSLEVNEAKTNVVKTIFMGIIPIIIIVLGVYVYIKRRNA